MTINKKFLAIAVALFAVFGFSFAEEVLAGSEHNVSGWAWSSNIGWISFNSTTGGGGTNYGVHINQDGTLTGYAWSENIGWINFAPASPYPDTPNYSAKVDIGNGQVSGWARALAYGGGWDGWIKTRGSNYGVSINFVNGEFSGLAWSDEVIGWLSFKGTNYVVITSFVPPPSISNLGNVFSPCSQSRIPTFSWETDAAIPYDYQIRLCSNSDCTGASDPLVSELKESTSSTSWAPACTFACDISPYNSIIFDGGTYYGQVRARNLGGEWSGWASSAFATYNHAYPYADFLCDGEDCEAENIYEETVISLTNNSTTHNGTLSCSWDLPLMAEVVGRSLQFDGTNDYVDLLNDLGYTTQVSAFAWFKSQGSPKGGYHIILGGQQLEISIPTSGELRTGVYTTSRYVSNHGSGLVDGSWHYVGFTFDGSVKKSYIDGEFVGEQTGITGSLAYSFADRKIGRYGSSTVYYANGLIDEARIYNRALSLTEIEEHYVGIFSNESGLVLNLPMDEVEGDTVYDKSPSANHGILGPDYPADSPIRLLGNPALDCNIKIKFSAPPAGQRNQPVEFTVKDTANYSCSETKILGIRFPLPEYKEVSPVSWLKNFFASLLPEW